MSDNGHRRGTFEDFYGDGLLKPSIVCKRLSVSSSWLYDAAKDRRIPPTAAIRLGGADGPLRFDPRGLDEWIENERAQWTPGRSRA